MKNLNEGLLQSLAPTSTPLTYCRINASMDELFSSSLALMQVIYLYFDVQLNHTDKSMSLGIKEDNLAPLGNMDPYQIKLLKY
jgi:hypothetical protein